MKRILLVSFLLLANRLEAATYYVSNSGNDANLCSVATTTTQVNNKRTIKEGVACLNAGDTLLIRGGTYTGANNRIHYSNTVRSGTSWSNAVTIKNYPSETVILLPPDSVQPLALQGVYRFIRFEGLTFDCGNTSNYLFIECVYFSQVSDIRFIGNTVRNAPNFGFVGDVASVRMEIQGNLIRNNGRALGTATEGHGIYFTGSDSTISDNTIEDNFGYGIHMYNNDELQLNPSRNIVERNIIRNYGRHSTPGNPAGYPAYAIVVSEGTDNIIRNNLILNTSQTYGIQVYTRSNNTKIYNNTIIGGLACIDLQFYRSAGEIRQNILFNCGADPIHDYGGSGAGPTSSNNVTTDPSFTGVNDYTLSAASTIAFNVNTCPSGVSVDILGNSRVGNCDAGAYEYLGGASPPVITTLIAPDGEEDLAIDWEFCATGGTPPFKWSFTGTLPTGSSHTDTTEDCSRVTGVVTTPGTFNYSMVVTDSASQIDTQAYSSDILAVDDGECPDGLGPWSYLAGSCLGASSSNGSANATTAAVTVSVGQLGICGLAFDKNSTPPTVNDTLGNTWTRIEPDDPVQGEYGEARAYYSIYTVAGSNQFRAVTGGETSFPSIRCKTFIRSDPTPLGTVVEGSSVTSSSVVQAGVLTTTLPWQVAISILETENSNVLTVNGWDVKQNNFSSGAAFGLGFAIDIVPLSSEEISADWEWSLPMSAAGFSFLIDNLSFSESIFRGRFVQ
jgi:hypothetical protein